MEDQGGKGYAESHDTGPLSKTDTITLPRTEYDALISRNEDLEDRLAAFDADDGTRIPHQVALAMMRGESPSVAFRNHLGFTLRDLAAKTGIAASYLSEIERGIKPGSTKALSRMAAAFGTTLDVLVKLS